MKQLILALLAVILMIYIGLMGMESHASSGPFFMFVGCCTAIGLSMDVYNAVRERIRKAQIRKLRP